MHTVSTPAGSLHSGCLSSVMCLGCVGSQRATTFGRSNQYSSSCCSEGLFITLVRNTGFRLSQENPKKSRCREIVPSLISPRLPNLQPLTATPQNSVLWSPRPASQTLDFWIFRALQLGSKTHHPRICIIFGVLGTNLASLLNQCEILSVFPWTVE